MKLYKRHWNSNKTPHDITNILKRKQTQIEVAQRQAFQNILESII